MKIVYMVRCGVTDEWPELCWDTTLGIFSDKEKANTAVSEIIEIISEQLDDDDESFVDKYTMIRKRLAEVYKKYALNEPWRFDKDGGVYYTEVPDDAWIVEVPFFD